MGIRILLADDHKLMRDGLRALIDSQPDMKVVATAENGRMAVRLAQKHNPDVVIVDVSMPELNGIDATRQIVSEFPDMKIIALSMHADRQFVEGMLKAGACGYLLKDCALDELIQAISSVMNRQVWLSPGIAGTVVKSFLHPQKETDTEIHAELSPREREVLQLIAEGTKTREISERLNVSIKTVETHRRKLMEKLSVDSIAGLTKIALKMGLTSLDT